MTKEEKFVVNPLEKYFLDYKRSGAKWKTKHRPRFGTAAVGWDLQMERNKLVLLIEAKYIRGPFASALAGLVISPLTNKTEKMKSNKKKSWSAVVCWAIGYGGGQGNFKHVYQILLDCFARNLDFWKAYSKLLKVKYIFLVDKQKIAKISFNKILKFAQEYKPSSERSLKERRIIAEGLFKHLKFK